MEKESEDPHFVQTALLTWLAQCTISAYALRSNADFVQTALLTLHTVCDDCDAKTSAYVVCGIADFVQTALLTECLRHNIQALNSKP